jgi:hypothetical protein
MTIQNGPRIQDVQYTPTGQGGVAATAMRDAATGQTFVQGPNGQFYPAGGVPDLNAGPPSAGLGFGNAQTNIVSAGLDAATAANAGVPLNPMTTEVLGRMRLAGVTPSSPVGQRMLADAVSEWNRNQTQLAVAQITSQPHMIAAQAAAQQVGNAAKLADAEVKINAEIDKEFPHGIDTAKRKILVDERMATARRLYGGGAAQPVLQQPGISQPAAPQQPGTPQQSVAPGQAAIDAMNKGTTASDGGRASTALPEELETPLRSLKDDPTLGAVPSLSPEDMMTRAYLYDQRHQGFLRGPGGAILKQRMQEAYGPDALANAARVSPMSALGGRIQFGDIGEKDKAMAAWRDALGLPLEGNAGLRWLSPINSPISPIGNIIRSLNYFTGGPGGMPSPPSSGFLK